jgi:hypothetical protein
MIVFVSNLDKIAVFIFITPFLLGSLEVQFEKLLERATDFVTLLAFGLVISTIGKKDLIEVQKSVNKFKSKYYIEKNKKISTMESEATQKAIKDLTIAEYNSVLQINRIILELKRLDSYTHYNSRTHDGWSILHDTLVYYELFNEKPFYDMKVNDLFSSFYKALGSASSHYGTASFPNNTHLIANINFFNVNMEITSYKTQNDSDVQKGNEDLIKALGYWDSLKKITTDRYEKFGIISLIDEEHAELN